MRWLVLVISIGMSGCTHELAGQHLGRGVEGGYICNLQDDHIGLQRLSFDIPEIFMGKPCSDFADYSNHKPGDWFSVGGKLQGRQAGSVYVDVFSVGFKVVGGLTETGLEHGLDPEEFVEFKWDQSADKVSPDLIKISWEERAGKRCAKLDYMAEGPIAYKRIVEYWCWDRGVGVDVPFLIRAYEVVAPGQAWQIDLEGVIFAPVFSSLRFNPITEEYRQAVRNQSSVLCGRHIKSYTERGVGWLTGVTTEPKWTPVFLKRCGYGPGSAAERLTHPTASM